MTDFSFPHFQPALMLLGAAAQIGIFATFIGALMLGFYPPKQAPSASSGCRYRQPSFVFKLPMEWQYRRLHRQWSAHLCRKTSSVPDRHCRLFVYGTGASVQPPLCACSQPTKKASHPDEAATGSRENREGPLPHHRVLLTTFISPSALPLLGMLFLATYSRSGVTKRLY